MLNGDAHTGALGGTTSEAGQMGAMASEPDLVHDVSYDRELAYPLVFGYMSESIRLFALQSSS